MRSPAFPPETAAGAASGLRSLIAQGADLVPPPAIGQTLARWRCLADVAQHDLALSKLFEGHTDAIAILAELGGPGRSRDSAWATWCAEPPEARLALTDPDSSGAVRLTGRKAWCSGAAEVDHAIVSGWNSVGAPCLAAVCLHQSAIRITDDGWNAVGMAGTGSVDVEFDGAAGVAVGGPHSYTRRPGFWHGGAGIAACWWGGAVGIAQAVHAALRMRATPDAHQWAHLGSIDAALQSAASVLRAAADWIDRHPMDDAQAWALRARLVVERCAASVLWHAGRTLGAGPLCKDARLARAMADLPVYMRQSHAERDLAALGRHVVQDPSPWQL